MSAGQSVGLAFSFDELGMVLEEGSELVPCADEALTALRDAGTLEELETEFLDNPAGLSR